MNWILMIITFVIIAAMSVAGVMITHIFATMQHTPGESSGHRTVLIASALSWTTAAIALVAFWMSKDEEFESKFSPFVLGIIMTLLILSALITFTIGHFEMKASSDWAVNNKYNGRSIIIILGFAALLAVMIFVDFFLYFYRKETAGRVTSKYSQIEGEVVSRKYKSDRISDTKSIIKKYETLVDYYANMSLRKEIMKYDSDLRDIKDKIDREIEPERNIQLIKDYRSLEATRSDAISVGRNYYDAIEAAREKLKDIKGEKLSKDDLETKLDEISDSLKLQIDLDAGEQYKTLIERQKRYAERIESEKEAKKVKAKTLKEPTTASVASAAAVLAPQEVAERVKQVKAASAAEARAERAKSTAKRNADAAEAKRKMDAAAAAAREESAAKRRKDKEDAASAEKEAKEIFDKWAADKKKRKIEIQEEERDISTEQDILARKALFPPPPLVSAKEKEKRKLIAAQNLEEAEANARMIADLRRTAKEEEIEKAKNEFLEAEKDKKLKEEADEIHQRLFEEESKRPIEKGSKKKASSSKALKVSDAEASERLNEQAKFLAKMLTYSDVNKIKEKSKSNIQKFKRELENNPANVDKEEIDNLLKRLNTRLKEIYEKKIDEIYNKKNNNLFLLGDPELFNEDNVQVKKNLENENIILDSIASGSLRDEIEADKLSPKDTKNLLEKLDEILNLKFYNPLVEQSQLIPF